MAQGLVLRVSLPRLLPRRAQEDVGRILFPQAELISPEVDLDGVAEGGDLLHGDLGARGQAHVHQPPLHRPPLAAHGLDDAGLARSQVLQSMGLLSLLCCHVHPCFQVSVSFKHISYHFRRKKARGERRRRPLLQAPNVFTKNRFFCMRPKKRFLKSKEKR